jgi:hypothetical protein
MIFADTGKGFSVVNVHRFPPPWSVEKRTPWFIIREGNAQALA